MVRGFYSAVSGMLSQEKALDVISNNIANATTTGFKTQSTVESTFAEHMISKMSSADSVDSGVIGAGAFITINNQEYCDFSQGNLEDTGRSLDLAIQGEGFFLVENEDYGQVLTRNGQFEISEEGYLEVPGLGRVLNSQEKEIKLKSSDFVVDGNGQITENGRKAGTLYIGNAKEDDALIKVKEDAFYNKNGYDKVDDEAYNVAQGTKESSNINMAKEMSKIISGQNHFQACSQIVKIYDRINEATVNQIGKIG